MNIMRFGVLALRGRVGDFVVEEDVEINKRRFVMAHQLGLDRNAATLTLIIVRTRMISTSIVLDINLYVGTHERLYGHTEQMGYV